MTIYEYELDLFYPYVFIFLLSFLLKSEMSSSFGNRHSLKEK